MRERVRVIDFFGPVALALGVIIAVGVIRQQDSLNAAHADPPWTQSASSLPGGSAPPDGPLFSSNASNQRKAQTDVLHEILDELRAIRKMLRDGGTRVKVDSIELDYDRLADAVSSAIPASRAGGGQPNGSIKRTRSGSEQESDK